MRHNYKQALYYGQNYLHEANITSYSIDARLLLLHLLEISFEEFILQDDHKFDQYDAYESLLARRAAYEPIAYIINKSEFYGREFYINNKVLIPRDDTEILIDVAKLGDYQNILEIGVGSGCISISLAKELEVRSITAVDISQEALAIAKINAARHGVALNLLQSDGFANVPADKFDLIIANPPYISINEKPLMSVETLKFEPVAALFAKDDGLYFYEIIAREAKDFLQYNGHIIVEIGFRQKELVIAIFKKHGFELIGTYQDIGQNDRCLQFKMVDC